MLKILVHFLNPHSYRSLKWRIDCGDINNSLLEIHPLPRNTSPAYSYLKLSAGLAVAALMDWKLTVTTAIANAAKVARAKIQTPIFVR